MQCFYQRRHTFCDRVTVVRDNNKESCGRRFLVKSIIRIYSLPLEMPEATRQMLNKQCDVNDISICGPFFYLHE